MGKTEAGTGATITGPISACRLFRFLIVLLGFVPVLGVKLGYYDFKEPGYCLSQRLHVSGSDITVLLQWGTGNPVQF